MRQIEMISARSETANSQRWFRLAAWSVDRVLDVLLWMKFAARQSPRRVGRFAGLLNSRAGSGNARNIAIWLHAFVCYVFDLCAGPEIVQFFIRLFAHTRPLSSVEKIAAVEVLGSRAIRYKDVRVASGGFLKVAFRLNNHRAFATWYTINVPAFRQSDRSLIVHELTHVYQYERIGSPYIGQGLWVQFKMGRGAYEYGGSRGLRLDRSAGKRLQDYNREQQSQIAQDYSARLAEKRDTDAYRPYIQELQAGQL